MSRTARRLATTFTLGLLLAVTASCGDEEPEPIPKPSTSPSPSVSPAPSAPTLNDKQRADYDAAVLKYADYIALVDRVGEDPKVTDEVAVELAQLATKPVTGEFSDGLDELIRNKAHTEGHREVAWSSPVSVKVDKEVVFLQCKTPGTWVAVKGEKRVPQKGNTISKVTAVVYKSKWFVQKNERAGEC